MKKPGPKNFFFCRGCCNTVTLIDEKENEFI